MKIHDLKQGSPEWHKARLGIPTASEFDALISPLGKVRTGEGVETYLHRKLCEHIMGCPQSEGSSFSMENGSILENEARPWLAVSHDLAIETVGFITTDDSRAGASPDGLIGDEEGLEIKCPTNPVHLKYLLAGVLPSEYVAQVQGSMYVTGRPRWRFLSYSRQFPPLILTVPHDAIFQANLKTALDGFNARFDAALTRIQAMKDPREAAYEAAMSKASTVSI